MKNKTENMQTTLFETEKPLQNNCGNPLLTAAAAREKLKEEFRKNHPFVYHLLRLDNGKLFHINSLWKDYNDKDYPTEARENRMRKYHDCKTIDEIKQVMKQPKENPKQLHYIMARIDYELLKQMDDFLHDE